MKRYLLSLFLIFSLESVCSAQPMDVVAIFALPNLDSIAQPHPTQGQTPIIPNDKPYYGMHKTVVTSAQPGPVFKYGRIVVRFYDKTNNRLLKINELGGLTVRFQVESKQPVPVSIPSDQMNMTDLVIKFEDYYASLGVTHGTKFTLSVEFGNSNFLQKAFSAPFEYVDKVSFYGALNTNSGGFWFPAFQFSSNLRKTENGIPFASLPIGLAWGLKRNWRNTYLGFSVMGNILLYSQTGSDQVQTSSSFIAAGGTVGCLFDISDVVTVGYAYGVNFKKGGSDPGHMFVLGFGSRSFLFLKNSNKPQAKLPDPVGIF